MKKFLLILLIFFLCGIISADICIEKLELSNVVLDLDVYRSYANAKLTFKDVFWNICYERVKIVFLFLLLGFTPIKERISFVLICLFSFMWGFFFMTCVMGLGLAGVVVGISTVIPHGLIYGLMLLLMFRDRKSYGFQRRERLLTSATSYLIMCLLFITGCIIESLMGTHFLPWVIRLGLI